VQVGGELWEPASAKAYRLLGVLPIRCERLIAERALTIEGRGSIIGTYMADSALATPQDAQIGSRMDLAACICVGRARTGGRVGGVRRTTPENLLVAGGAFATVGSTRA
jgi:hypothetical protein